MLRSAPLLVVEVLSRSTRGEDWGRKRELYAAAGLPWYWVADPEQEALTVLRNDDGQLAAVQTLRGTQARTDPFPILLDLPSIFG